MTVLGRKSFILEALYIRANPRIRTAGPAVCDSIVAVSLIFHRQFDNPGKVLSSVFANNISYPRCQI